MPQANKLRAYPTARFALELQDDDASVPVAYINSIDGGQFKSEPVKYLAGNAKHPTLYPGRPKFDDITIQMGLAVAPAFYKWVKASFDGKPFKRKGAIVGYDYDHNEVSRREFTGAVLSEVQFPALDAAAKNQGQMTVKMSPETLEWKTGDGSRLNPSWAQHEITNSRKWLTSNFRLVIDKFKQQNLRYVKVEAMTVKQNVINNPVGSRLVNDKTFGRVEVPNLVVTLPESEASHWWKWFEHTVIKGQHGEPTTAALTWLSYDLKDELATLHMSGVQLLAMETEKYEAGKDQVAKVKCTMCVESMRFEKGSGNS